RARLPGRPGRRPAGAAATPPPPVHLVPPEASLDGGRHELCRSFQRTAQVGVRHRVDTRPGRQLGCPERLGQPLVAYPGDEMLVEQRLADEAAAVLAAYACDHRVDLR